MALDRPATPHRRPEAGPDAPRDPLAIVLAAMVREALANRAAARGRLRVVDGGRER